MINQSVVSKGMAGKAAASGLTFHHLNVAFKREGPVGIESLLSETTVEGKVRVTKSKNIIAKLVSHFNN
ncbi:MAG: hypothetical protein DSY43_05560 [Gammaproteobacteria bacterium]|nr:MAG: hypothetical protein DSY43_05560 [Gammaproteobacteria bacterium]